MLETLIDALYLADIAGKIVDVGRGVEVELYTVYLDLWWEVQFLLDPSLLSATFGC